MDTSDSQKAVANADLPRRMPWSVRTASIIADSYCAIAAIAIVAIAVYKRVPGTLAILVPLLLMFGACRDLHRGHRWTLRFFRAIGAIFAVPLIADVVDGRFAPHCIEHFVLLPMIVVPVLLYFPPSRQWWRPEGRFKWISCPMHGFFTVFLVFGVLFAHHDCVGPRARAIGKMQSEARGLFRLLSENPNAKEELVRAKSSTDFVNRLIAADVAAGRKPDGLLTSALVDGVCQWCFAVDVSENVADGIPVVFSANIDLADLPTEWDEKSGSRWIPANGRKRTDCDDYCFIMHKEGAAQYQKRKYLTVRNFYNMPTGRIDRTVFYLTPHGKKALGGNLGK